MHPQMKLFQLATICSFLWSMSQVGRAAEPDSDFDGVSDYDDYCPQTPNGLAVWTMDQYRNGLAKVEWVGCAGGDDHAAPGYKLPTRPQTPSPVPPPPGPVSEFARVRSLYMAGQAPQLKPNAGWFSGRCWESTPSEALASHCLSNRDQPKNPYFQRPQNFIRFMSLSSPVLIMIS